MKLLLISVSVIACAIAGQHTDRFDNMDLDGILSNKRLLQGYMRCVLNRGGCTAEGKELKSYIMDALQTECEKCSDHHRTSIKKVIKYVMKHEPKYWQEAVDKYDPDHKYIQKYEKNINEWQEED